MLYTVVEDKMNVWLIPDVFSFLRRVELVRNLSSVGTSRIAFDECDFFGGGGGG